MDINTAIKSRRAYRALDPVEITEDMILTLGAAAKLAPSCFNNQPWRFVFVYEKETLTALWDALSPANGWVKDASLIVAVFSRADMDCRINEREYYLFDTGIATGFMILQAEELNLVMHPIAGYNPDIVKNTLGIPGDMNVITLLAAGKHAETAGTPEREKYLEKDRTRPERKTIEEILFRNRFE
ncbi:MAG: nitroreductase family protein [Firmicutes bacterium]|nr:nitroreductase family protein [Bacillota bacterium]